jgi:MSHA biogenesis protein MshP
MYLKQLSLSVRKHQQGSMLVIALFVIVVLAFLGLTLTKILSSSNDNVIYEVLGQRALNAARSGIQCSLADTVNNSSSANCDNGVTYVFNDVAGLDNCQFTAEKISKEINDGSIKKDYYQFTSTGRCEVGSIVVSRTVYIDAIM